jgi:thiamine phosphate synthase YjbQ (UPF0047 family)
VLGHGANFCEFLRTNDDFSAAFGRQQEDLSGVWWRLVVSGRVSVLALEELLPKPDSFRIDDRWRRANEPPERRRLNITPQVKAALKESDVQEGIALINAMHITASVFINDDEQGLHADYEVWMGREVVVAITAGKLDFGPWEQIFYGEFDGGRRKRVLIKIIGE